MTNISIDPLVPPTRKEFVVDVSHTKALDKQVGGSHYKDFVIQPVEFIHKNGIGFLEGNAIKYICRWKRKGGKQDIEKAIHYLHMLMEMSDDATP